MNKVEMEENLMEKKIAKNPKLANKSKHNTMNKHE